MTTRIIIEDPEIRGVAEKAGFAPAGWYSRQQVGSHDEQEDRYVLEGTNPQEKPDGDFVYWEDRRQVDLPIAKKGQRDSGRAILSY